MTQSVLGRNPLGSGWTNVQGRAALAGAASVSAPFLSTPFPARGKELTMSRFMIALASVVIVGAVVAGCGSTKKTATAMSPPTTPVAMIIPDLTGTWSGQGGAQGRETPVALRIVQDGTTLDGDVYVSGRADLSGPVKGRVEGHTLRLTLGEGFTQTSALQISADGNEISGQMVGSPLTLRRSR